MAKSRYTLKWIKELLGIEVPRTDQPQSIVERLEGLIPPVEKICKSYKVDKHIALEIHREMVAIEERIKRTLKDQHKVVAAQELLIEQQGVTGTEIDIQVNKQLNAETIIQNFRIFLTEDELTITWILKNIIEPAVFAAAFGNLEPGWQRQLFNSLRTTVNSLQREHGMLTEPTKGPPSLTSSAEAG